MYQTCFQPPPNFYTSTFEKKHAYHFTYPEATSLQRATGFNRVKVARCYDRLCDVLFTENKTRHIPPSQIYNVDELGYTICHQPSKVLARKEKKTVSALTSAERGKIITAVLYASASGSFVLPILIYPRMLFREELIDTAPAGTIGKANKSGWINQDLFHEWFDHFLNETQPKHRDEPVLLILDGHTSHTRKLVLMEKARDYNVIILSLPSHCTRGHCTNNHQS